MTVLPRPKWHGAHRPHPVSTVAEVTTALTLYALDPRRPMSDEQIQELSVAFRLAFVQMLSGLASEEHWASCVCSLNIALVLAEWGLGEECIPEINQALEGAFRARVRARRTGKWGFDGPAIQAIKAAFDIHEQQLLYASKDQIRDSLQEVHKRADEGNVFFEAA